MKKISKKSRTVWLLSNIAISIGIVILASIIFYFFKEYELIKKSYFLTLSAVTVLFLKETILNSLAYKVTRYQLTVEYIWTKKGHIFIQETTIPLKRIQHVDIEQTFFSRLFNLYQINFYTAGDSHSLAFLKKEEAELLKDSIVQFVTKMGVDING